MGGRNPRRAATHDRHTPASQLIDNTLGMHRVEVKSASSGIHLGHVFADGPPPTSKRYRINGDVL